MSIKIKASGITHRNAMCCECSWQEFGVSSAVQAAKKHVKETGHEVTIETARSVRYHKVEAKDALQIAFDTGQRATRDR